MQPVLQPMDMGTIKSFKGYFRQFLVLRLIDRRERGLHDSVSLLDSIRLKKDAWDTVIPAMVINCFRKSGLSSGEFSVGDQNINEDDLPLSEWLKQNGITKFDHLSDTDSFIHADDDLMTSRIPAESDIIKTILNKEDSDEDNVEFVEDTISTKSVQAQDAVETLTEFFENRDTSGGVFDALSVIKGNLRDLQVKSCKQCTILNYLGTSMCKEGK
jgi:hypothetical protein